jgi:murein DD-endopeptidase MepM/ murein hydrolase activator NlpD
MDIHMSQRKVRRENRVPVRRSGKYLALLFGLLVILGLTVAIMMQRSVMNPAQPPPGHGPGANMPTATDKPAIAANTAVPAAAMKKEILDFYMQNLSLGWIQYVDSAASTKDGGATWTEAASGQITQGSVDDELQLLTGTLPKPNSVNFKSKTYQVKKSQFLTDRVGWVLAADSSNSGSVLLITTDGGATWYDQVTSAITAALNAEEKRIQAIKKEVSYYSAKEAAKTAIQSEWTLFPNTASPGDVVMVRHKQPGEVNWQGRAYPLRPFGLGYFAYLPLSMDLKPGSYPIGDRQLTVKAKKFESQYLKVTKQMESMRQNTDRINADQKKIDAARSRSQQDFLFSSTFIQPVEGILTTPFGYTRYVNGKLDSSHRAIDLAAEQGTPIKATNDGVVGLADSLYLTGNSIYIDHGMGLFSQYAHLSELRVKTGDKVKKGDIIGLVGSTGFSTGPHLHFTFWANNVPVNPNLFFGSTPFGWLDQSVNP